MFENVHETISAYQCMWQMAACAPYLCLGNPKIDGNFGLIRYISCVS